MRAWDLVLGLAGVLDAPSAASGRRGRSEGVNTQMAHSKRHGKQGYKVAWRKRPQGQLPRRWFVSEWAFCGGERFRLALSLTYQYPAYLADARLVEVRLLCMSLGDVYLIGA